MKIKHSTQPKNVASIVADTINDIVDHMDTHPLIGVDHDNLTISAPHSVHAVHLTELLSGKLGKNDKIGSRYILVDGTRPIADIEFTNNMDFAGMHQGPYVAATVEGVSIAAANKEYPSEYELRFVKVPALALICLWFKSRNSNLFMPLEPSPAQLDGFELYTEKELLKIVVPMARKAALQHN